MNLVVKDVEEIPHEDGVLDEVVVDEILHQLVEGAEEAVAECYRALKPGGTLIVNEDTPPMAHKLVPHHQPKITAWYEKIAEDRLTLTEWDIVNLMADAGFRQIHIDTRYANGVSVRQQLRESGLSKKAQRRIFGIYRRPPDEWVAQAYAWLPTKTDIQIKTRHVTIKGTKPGGDESAESMELVKHHIPELFDRPGKLLYIGAGVRIDGLCEVKAAGHEVTVLEIWPPYIWMLTSNMCIDHLIQGDVLEIASLELPHEHYDVAMWWHGPEHIEKDKVPGVLKQLEGLADLVVLGCPNGVFEVGTRHGNPYEAHLGHWYADDFKRLGYEAQALNALIDTMGSALLAWRKCGTV